MWVYSPLKKRKNKREKKKNFKEGLKEKQILDSAVKNKQNTCTSISESAVAK